MGLGGIQALGRNPGGVRIELKEARLQAGGDEALVGPEGEAAVLAGHLSGGRLLGRDPGCHTRLAESATR